MAIGPDLVDVLVDDHRRIEDLLTTVTRNEEAVDHADQDRRLVAGIAELARHIVVEEDYLYPVVGEIGPREKVMAADALSRSQQAEWTMRDLERISPGPGRDRLVGDLLEFLQQHVAETEGGLFSALRRAYPPAQLEHLAGVVEMAMRTAPTRAHPGAPSTPPWNQILTPAIGLVDKVRDAVSGRRTKPDQQ